MQAQASTNLLVVFRPEFKAITSGYVALSLLTSPGHRAHLRQEARRAASVREAGTSSVYLGAQFNNQARIES